MLKSTERQLYGWDLGGESGPPSQSARTRPATILMGTGQEYVQPKPASICVLYVAQDPALA